MTQQLLPASFKNSVTAFIKDEKRLPNKEEMAKIRQETMPTNHIDADQFTSWLNPSIFTSHIQPNKQAVIAPPRWNTIYDYKKADDDWQELLEFVDSQVQLTSALESTKGVTRHNVSSDWLTYMANKYER